MDQVSLIVISFREQAMKTIVIVSGNTKSTFFFLLCLTLMLQKLFPPSVSRGWHGLGPALGRPPVLEASGVQEPGARGGGGPGAMGAHASHQPATAAGGWNHPGR